MKFRLLHVGCIAHLRWMMAAGALLAFSSAALRAETSLGLLVGSAWTADSDVRYETSAGTNLTFADAAWDTDPFGSPPYYAFRLSHWFRDLPGWGWAFDFTHAKMISDPDRVVRVSGSRDGAPVSSFERIGDTFDELEFSDGHNLLTLNALRRWQPFDGDLGSLSRHSSLYVGAGVGIAVPHVEVRTIESFVREYQYAGPALQLMTGAVLPVGDRWSLQLEYRLTWAELDTDLNDGGSLTTDALTHHLNLGIGFDF